MGIPVVVEPVVVPVPNPIVEVEVANVQVAVIGVAVAYREPSAQLPLEARAISGLHRIRHHNALAFYTKYLHFLLKFLHAPLYPKPWSKKFSMHGYWIQ